MKKILSILGARPQFVKAAAMSRAFKNSTIAESIVHTGQHFDANMSDVFFDQLEIPAPKHLLEISGGGHGQMTGRMLEKLEALFITEKPDAVMVYGDTNSTLAGALAAAKLHIPVIHIEAGLRSFNKKMPEEVNRILTDHISHLLFCPTQTAVDNLKTENITENVFMVGDVMYDATLFAMKKAEGNSTIISELSLDQVPFALSTIHRAENTDSLQNLKEIIAFLNDATTHTVILPLHPRTRKMMESYGLNFGHVRTIDPLGYFDMQQLLSKAELVLTDSGGLQKEAYFHQKPCITLRDQTEWVETIDAGWNRLWKTPNFKTPRTPIADYGTGKSAEAIVAILEQKL